MLLHITRSIHADVSTVGDLEQLLKTIIEQGATGDTPLLKPVHVDLDIEESLGEPPLERPEVELRPMQELRPPASFTREPARPELEQKLGESVAQHAPAAPPVTGGADPTKPTPEQLAAVELFMSEQVVDDPAGRVPTQELRDAYDEWRHQIDGPELAGPIKFGRAVRELRPDLQKGQLNYGEAKAENTPRYTYWRGITLRPKQTAREPETEDHTPPVVELLPAICASPTKPPRHERRQRAVPVGYNGDRPGREIPRDWAEQIVRPLIAAGWTYRRSNSNGKGKPRVIGPDGQHYALANTPSDWRSLKNTRADLRRMGATAI